MIEISPFREPVSALTHGAWVLLCIPGVILLVRHARNDKLKTIGLLIYGLSMIACFASSCLFHTVRGSESLIEACRSLDHVCIFLFIAGTCTPMGLVFFEKKFRFLFLSSIWFLAIVGITMRLTDLSMPLYKRTTLYLLLGWMGLLIYIQLLKKLPTKKVMPILLGGVIYSVGAALNLAQQPVIIPGFMGPHEFFHMMVILGSLVHYYFMIKTLAQYKKPIFLPTHDFSAPLVFANSAVAVQEIPMARKSA